ncbi:hypothetical protein [Aureispira anguillae]|uniref:Uncharacterized protein n=1 Tax=Aureispira anguillae TaxID=2864201 RepID=A0A916DV29_9BACT|nr:hypothetical protein [Aureispira anguillae]BDS12746.1 hypothetical protein AsAng_0034710 [Aureispira anguillae]
MSLTITNYNNNHFWGILNTIQGVASIYSGVGKNLLSMFVLLVVTPFLWIGLTLLGIYGLYEIKRMHRGLKGMVINTEKDYDFLKKEYDRTENALKGRKMDPSKKMPFVIVIFFGPMYYAAKELNAMNKTLSEKLYILPKNLSSAQISEAAKLNGGLEELLEDGDDDYAKAIALGQIKFIKR